MPQTRKSLRPGPYPIKNQGIVATLSWIRPIKSRDFFKPLQMVKSSILFFLQYEALVSDHWVALAWTN